MKNGYYVYILIDPRDKMPFYVGKGKNKRYLEHEKELDKQIVYLSNNNSSPEKLLSLKQRVIFDLKQCNLTYEFELIEGLIEEDAFMLEQALIAWFGRRLCGNGVLTNLLSGGKNGELYFDDQLLIQVYNRSDMLHIITKYPKLSEAWIAKTLYFYDKDVRGYPFVELKIDWLYQYHRAYEQFAVEVVNLLKEYDSVITPFYWVRKVKHNKLKDDSLFIMKNCMELIEGTYLRNYGDSEFNEYVADNAILIDKL